MRKTRQPMGNRRRKNRPQTKTLLAGLLLLAAVTATVAGCIARKATGPVEPITSETTTATTESTQTQPPEETQLPQILSHDIPDTAPLEYPFNTMSMDWGEDDLDGWRHYELPEEYQRSGGYLPDLVQVYTYCLCRQNRIPYPLVLAMIEVESGYRWDAVSSEGAVGYLQIIPRYHAHRFPAGNDEAALANPYSNIRAGIEYLAELRERFDNMDFVLSAYQYGVAGAYQNAREDGGSAYSDRVLAVMERIEAQLEGRPATINPADTAPADTAPADTAQAATNPEGGGVDE